MSRTTYDLREPDSVNAYLTRVKGEHNPAFEPWRQRRTSEGFHRFVVEHPEGLPTPPSEAGFLSHSPAAWCRPGW
jgi:hypothetical protein